MKTKEDLLNEYDAENQDTKREIIRFLYNNPDIEHDPETVFEAIREDCRAGKAGTVANQLSELSQNEDQIELEEKSFYQWSGKGNPNPNRRLHEVGVSVRGWLDSLRLSLGTFVFAFLVWLLGLLCGAGSLISIFISPEFLGLSADAWFQLAGLLTVLGSFAFTLWVPLYVLDTLRAA